LLFYKNVLAAMLYARVLVIESTARENLYKRVLSFATRLSLIEATPGFDEWVVVEDVPAFGQVARVEGRVWPPCEAPPPSAETMADGSYIAVLAGRDESYQLGLDIHAGLSKVLAPASVLFCLSEVVADSDAFHRRQLARLLGSVSTYYREHRSRLVAPWFDSKAVEFALAELRAASGPGDEPNWLSGAASEGDGLTSAPLAKTSSKPPVEASVPLGSVQIGPYKLNMPLEGLHGLTEIPDYEYTLDMDNPGGNLIHFRLDKRKADMIPQEQFYKAPWLKFLNETWNVLLSVVDGSIIEIQLALPLGKREAEALAGRVVAHFCEHLGKPQEQKVWRGEWDTADGSVMVGAQRAFGGLEVLILVQSSARSTLQQWELPKGQ
jgi:hypothetical protein